MYLHLYCNLLATAGKTKLKASKNTSSMSKAAIEDGQVSGAAGYNAEASSSAHPQAFSLLLTPSPVLSFSSAEAEASPSLPLVTLPPKLLDSESPLAAILTARDFFISYDDISSAVLELQRAAASADEGDQPILFGLILELHNLMLAAKPLLPAPCM